MSGKHNSKSNLGSRNNCNKNQINYLTISKNTLNPKFDTLIIYSKSSLNFEQKYNYQEEGCKFKIFKH